jgi:hypothetical protein
VTEPLAWSHRVSEIPEGGLREVREASAAERAEVVASLDLIACDFLKADYTIRSLGEGRYRMRGSLIARLTQQCVVTLEPIPQDIAEDFDIEFWPPGTLPEVGDAEVEVLSVPDIEPIAHGKIEAGCIIFEILSTSLDPYPRKAEASFQWEGEAASVRPEQESPFAALSKLKK